MARKICLPSRLLFIALFALFLIGVECSYFENMVRRLLVYITADKENGFELLFTTSTDRPAHERPHAGVSRTSLSSSSVRNNPNTAKQPTNLKERLTWLMNTKSGKIWALPNTNDPTSRTRPVFHSWYSADSLYPYPHKRVITRF